MKSQGVWLLFASACCVLCLVGCQYIKADFSNVWERSISISDTFNDSDMSCNNGYRPVFKLLHLDNTSLLAGSTECVWVLDPDTLVVNSSASIQISDEETCNFVIQESQRPYRCKNYIVVGEKLNSTTYYVCGTNNAATPSCETREINGNNLINTSQVPSSNMARSPNQNITVKFDENGTFYYIATLTAAAGTNVAFLKVNTADGQETVATLNNDDTWMYSPIDFVGEPIEYKGYVYFFFRERAQEYDNLGRIIYSRVARVCQNDDGGTTSPLDGRYRTFLKTRLQCSVGDEFPFFFNEVQDVRQFPDNESNIVYGLFTTAAAGTSSSAICRYDLDELDNLFDLDRRRGQLSSDQVWRRLTRDPEDTLERRECTEAYPTSAYTHISNFPFVNTPALNCRSASCNNYGGRTSDDPLAIIEGVRGEKMAIQSETNDTVPELVIYIGTNNRTVYKITLTNWTGSATAEVNERITLPEAVFDFNETDRANKWPYSVTTLEIQNGMVYGSTDGYIFKFQTGADCSSLTTCLQCYKQRKQGCEWDRTNLNCSQGTPSDDDCTTFGCGSCTCPHPLTEIKDRSGKVQEANYTSTIDEAVVTISRLYEGPMDADLQANFSGGLDSCSSRQFKSSSGCREFLAVHCEIRGITEQLDEVIEVFSATKKVPRKLFPVTVNVDPSDAVDFEIANKINDYDRDMAKYQYEFQNWVDTDVDCSVNSGDKSTCPAATSCRYCQP